MRDSAQAFTEVRPTNLVVIQPTPFCNLDCSYCYLPNRSDRSKLGLETISAIGQFLLTVPDLDPNIPIVWHAGEPMVMTRNYYEAAFGALAEVLGARGVTPTHNFQTNAALVNANWCQFFSDQRVRVGVSIDGPREMHDSHRVDRRGRGSFDRVMRGVHLLQECGLPFSVICVLSEASMRDPDTLMRFFVDHGIFIIGFNIQEVEGANRVSHLANPATASLYRNFFQSVIKWCEAVPQLNIRELHDTRTRLTSQSGLGTYSSENQLGSILSFGVDGSVSTFSPELITAAPDRYSSFTWGNVEDDDFESFIATVRRSRVWEDMLSGIHACKRDCEFFGVCGGGAPSNKLAELGTLAGTETDSCRLQVMTMSELVLENLEREISFR